MRLICAPHGFRPIVLKRNRETQFFVGHRRRDTMARPREFDEQAVLDAATEWFWKNGYEATSVRDLADRMDMTTASLYNAFGDKRALYRLVLDRYASVALRRCADALRGDMPPLRGIELFFNTIVEDALN